ncbi:Leu/Phe/Val dehydrogenase [Halocatena marina]|uniref:Leu/Phe/Val dehydrogenase n=1 Tax=Halocatena marina TaxID=2934937 RepID=A0ABD5YJU7_9EURY|nr:amino acid dehydrogenase [Halocatena marina]
MTDLLDRMANNGHTELKAFRDEATGLKGFVGIHDTTLGSAGGGTRRYAFESEADAIEDVLRLSRAMTYKYALAGVNMGGAKAIIWIDEDEHSEELYRSYGRIVDSFDGRFVTGGDIGTDVRELRWIGMETDYVVGLPEQFDHPSGYHGGGLGVIRAMEACSDLVYDDRSLGDLHVVVQGVGEMGTSIVRYLDDEGADVTVADPDTASVDRLVDHYGVSTVAPKNVYDVDCDIFAPSALGFVLNDETIPRLQCDIICGAANNQLEDEKRHGSKLHNRGILYAPDYLANAGRTIDDTDLLRTGGYNHERAREMVNRIYDRMLTIGRRSRTEDRPTGEIADEIAEARIEALREMRSPVTETRVPQW